MARPKRITPNSRTQRTLYFDKEDIDALIEHLHVHFFQIFTRGARMDFVYLGDHLSFSPLHRITPASAKRNLKGLGINPNLIDMAIKAIESTAKEGFPTTDQIRYGQWFGSILAGYLGMKIKEHLHTTPASRAKWDRRLKECGRTWGNLTLSDEAIAKLTEELFRAVLKQTIRANTIKKRLIRWKQEHMAT